MPPKPLILGVLNVTPDSFSDGGKYATLDRALAGARELVEAGADILDVGGESSRPGAEPVALQDELDRVLPVVEAIVSELGVTVSVDTRKYEVAEAALRSGATIINDISGGQDARLLSLAARGDFSILLMHMQGDPRNMQLAPTYPGGVVEEVKAFLQERVALFEKAGVRRERIWVDPGIGFGKTLDHNLELLRRLKEFRDIGGRLAIGTSRKAFLGGPISDREPGTLASNLWAYRQGASVFRVHDVAALRRALSTWTSIEGDPDARLS